MSRLRQHLERHGSERGLSLVEVLVASLVLVVLLPIGGGLLTSALGSERHVRSVTDAGTGAQLVVMSVEAGVRNAAALRYTRSGTANADEMLVVRSQAARHPDGPGETVVPTWYCLAWFYSGDRDTVQHRRVPAVGTTPVITGPPGADAPGWSTLAEGVVPGGPSELHGIVMPAGSLPGVFTPSTSPPSTVAKRVDIELAPRTDARRPANTISTSVVRRPQGQGGGSPCF